jgi:hypothetical protein
LSPFRRWRRAGSAADVPDLLMAGHVWMRVECEESTGNRGSPRPARDFAI